MSLFKGNPLHGVGKIGHIGTINDNQCNVGNQINRIQDALIPTLFAETEGEDGEQNEEAVGPKYRHGVEHQGTFGNA